MKLGNAIAKVRTVTAFVSTLERNSLNRIQVHTSLNVMGNAFTVRHGCQSFVQSPPWKECCQMYFSLEQHVVSGKVLQLSSAEELESLHCVLRDFASLLQLIGRVSTLFIGDDFLARLQEAGELVKQLIVLAAYGTRMKFYSLQIPAASTSSSPDVLRDFVEV